MFRIKRDNLLHAISGRKEDKTLLLVGLFKVHLFEFKRGGI